MDYHPAVQAITTRLDTADVWYDLFGHAPITTSQEAAEVRDQYSLSDGAKALIVKLYKADGEEEFVMLAIPGDREFDKRKVLNETNAQNLRFSQEDEIAEITNEVEIGGIPPWGNIFNIQTYADRRLKEKEVIVFNAGDRRVSIAMRPDDYIDIVEPTIVDIV